MRSFIDVQNGQMLLFNKLSDNIYIDMNGNTYSQITNNNNGMNSFININTGQLTYLNEVNNYNNTNN